MRISFKSDGTQHVSSIRVCVLNSHQFMSQNKECTCIFGSSQTCPKKPFRTKNSTALESVVFGYRRSFSLSVPFSCLFCLEKKNKHFCALSVAFCYVCTEFSPRHRNSLSVVFFVREGPLGGCLQCLRFLRSFAPVLRLFSLFCALLWTCVRTLALICALLRLTALGTTAFGNSRHLFLLGWSIQIGVDFGEGDALKHFLCCLIGPG